LRKDSSIAAKRDPDLKKDPRSFCGDDQINEALADLIGSKVLVKYLNENKLISDPATTAKGYANVFRNWCSPDQFIKEHYSTDFFEHPKIEDRANRILLADPDVRAQLHCSPDYQYESCDIAPRSQQLLKQNSVVK
jgi:hypothetical protein